MVDCVYEKKKGEEKKSHIKSKWIISDNDENYDQFIERFFLISKTID